MNKLLIVAVLAGIPWLTHTYFELRNHDSLPVDAFVLQPATYQAQAPGVTEYKQARADFKRIAAKKGSAISTFSFPLVATQPTYLVLSYKDSQGRVEQAMYSFAVGKTIYIAWENGKIRPQKGSFGKTASGKSLRNNVSSYDIILLTKNEQELINQQLLESKEFQELVRTNKLKPIKKDYNGQWQKGY